MSVVRAVDDAFGDPDGSVAGRVLATLAHLVPYVLLAYLGLCAARWLSIVEPNTTTSLIAVAVLIVVTTAGGFHTVLARLCLPCMRSLPADAPVRVRRYLPLLWLVHRLRGWWSVLVVLGLLVVANATRTVADGVLGAGVWLNAPAELVMLSVMWGDWVHHRYRPWCPHCHRGGGGMREPSPDPTVGATK